MDKTEKKIHRKGKSKRIPPERTESIDKTAVEMLNSGGEKRLKKRKNNDNVRKISGLC
jgi:hypothetical protein